MSNVWAQSRYGRRIDLVDPTPEQVNLPEICYTLASIHRYAGAARPPVSVAVHSLIVDDICAVIFPAARPWGLIHDFHEGIPVGDVTTPTLDALAAIAEEYYPGSGQSVVKLAMVELKWRHDIAIWAAAGIGRPSREIIEAVKLADRIALKIERRLHLGEPPEPWCVDTDGTPDFDGYFVGKYPTDGTEAGWALVLRLTEVLPQHVQLAA